MADGAADARADPRSGGGGSAPLRARPRPRSSTSPARSASATAASTAISPARRRCATRSPSAGWRGSPSRWQRSPPRTAPRRSGCGAGSTCWSPAKQPRPARSRSCSRPTSSSPAEAREVVKAHVDDARRPARADHRRRRRAGELAAADPAGAARAVFDATAASTIPRTRPSGPRPGDRGRLRAGGLARARRVERARLTTQPLPRALEVERRSGLFEDDEPHDREAVMLGPGERTPARIPARVLPALRAGCGRLRRGAWRRRARATARSPRGAGYRRVARRCSRGRAEGTQQERAHAPDYALARWGIPIIKSGEKTVIARTSAWCQDRGPAVRDRAGFCRPRA